MIPVNCGESNCTEGACYSTYFLALTRLNSRVYRRGTQRQSIKSAAFRCTLAIFQHIKSPFDVLSYVVNLMHTSQTLQQQIRNLYGGSGLQGFRSLPTIGGLKLVVIG